MKYECLSTPCFNKSDKFARTKRGIICLVCFEERVKCIPETEFERAQLATEEHMTRGTGGNNRKFTNAYRAMINHLRVLQNLENKTLEQLNYTQGFEEAVRVFNDNANGKKRQHGI
jgi:hypothetical protein